MTLLGHSPDVEPQPPGEAKYAGLIRQMIADDDYFSGVLEEKVEEVFEKVQEDLETYLVRGNADDKKAVEKFIATILEDIKRE